MLAFFRRLLGLTRSEAPTRADGGDDSPVEGASPARQAASAGAAVSRSKGTTPPPLLIGTWVYQLQEVRPARIAACNVDLAVVDYSADGTADEEFSASDVARMKTTPSGGQKRVVAYMSIGEAEAYRFYWNKAWKKKDARPSWLDRENPDWHENYKVRYWDPAWQAIIFGSPGAYLDKIIAAGFDGAYLDIIDAFEYYTRSRRTAAKDMVAFVTALAAYARAKRPDFLIIPQNGESLLADPGYRRIISAIAKEDLFFGLEDDEEANKAAEITESLQFLALAKDAGIPVLVVEYLANKQRIAQTREQLAAHGFAAYFAPRDLDEIRSSTLIA